MKKKIAAILTAAMVLTLGSASVFAEENPATVTTSNTTVSVGGGYEVGAISSQVQAYYTEWVEEFMNDPDIKPSEVQGKDITIALTLIDIEKGSETPDEKGYYYVPFQISGCSPDSVFAIVHFLGEGTVEGLSNLKPENGQIVVGTQEFSIFGVIEYIPDGAAPAPAPESAAPASSDGHTHFWQEYTVAATATTWGYTMSYCAGCGEQYAYNYVAPNGAVASPKTAETASMLPVLVLVCAAGAVFCTRKSVIGR